VSDGQTGSRRRELTGAYAVLAQVPDLGAGRLVLGHAVHDHPAFLGQVREGGDDGIGRLLQLEDHRAVLRPGGGTSSTTSTGSRAS